MEEPKVAKVKGKKRGKKRKKERKERKSEEIDGGSEERLGGFIGRLYTLIRAVLDVTKYKQIEPS